MRDYIGLVVCAPSVERKLRSKHGLTADLVREAIQYPARVMLAWDDDPRHGGRLVVLGTTATGRQLVVWLVPTPEWDPDTDVWLIKTARWVR
ncbi:MAG: hypothetical protein ABIR17_09005 [Pseudolysinimonas sp.]|uniref:hypothetical protein n=1 Tax=Pseudolysinimonas sp. TaxID=2680009 RepID=UPI003262DACE